MAKTNRATRKELETIVGELIKELQFLKQGFNALDNYLGLYVKFKGDTLIFNDFIKKEVEKAQNNTPETTVSKPKNKDIKSDKKERYKKHYL